MEGDLLASPPSPSPGPSPAGSVCRDVTFEWRYGGGDVRLAGTFNHWHGFSLSRQSDLWVGSARLPPGVYQYKFIVDGVWCYDILQEHIDDGSGNVNNLLFVDPPEVSGVGDLGASESGAGMSEVGNVGSPDGPEEFLELKPPLIKRESIEERIKFNIQPSLLNSAFFTPSVPVEARPPKLGSIKRSKFSSTATIFMTNLISAPDVKEIVICLSRVLYWNIRNHSKMEKRFYPEIFSETKFPLGDGKTNFTIIPTEDEILEFLVMIFSGQDLGAECGVMTAVYIDRLNKLTGIKFCPENWRRIVLGALMLASKVSEDSGVWNVDYLYSFPNISLKDLNRLETEYLICLKFTVSLTATVYARYYFELRSLSEMNEENFPVKPLDQQRAVLLERISKGMEQKAKRKRSGRSLSMDWNSYRPAGRVTLEQFQNRFCKKWQTWEENG